MRNCSLWPRDSTSFLTKPSGTSWQYGAYIGLIAAFVAVAPRVVPAIQARVKTKR
jgi:hypothetical protein